MNKKGLSERDICSKFITLALVSAKWDQGLESLESLDALKVIPFPQMGTPVELIHAFGSRNKYTSALRDLEAQLYSNTAQREKIPSRYPH